MNTRLLMLGLGTAAVAVVAGCPSSPQIPSSVNLPAAANFVANNPSTFRSNVGDAPATTPGTVVDALSGITGCWGAMAVSADSDPALFSTYSFDATAGTFEAVSWIGPVTGGIQADFPLFTVSSGQFFVDDASTVRIVTNTVLSNADAAGNLSSDATNSRTLNPPLTRNLTSTLSGNSWIVSFTGDDGSTQTLTYRKFACP